MRIFGRTLIIALSITFLMFSMGCSQKSLAGDNSFKAGTYTAVAEGHNGPVEVEVSFDETSITEIKVIRQSETKGLGDVAITKIIAAILKNQSLGVDTVSGATEASGAVLAAVSDCVKQAGGDVEAMKTDIIKAGAGKVEKLSTDIVVIGAGASGVSAAVAASDEGVKVILIEKTSTIGGASNLSWAGKFINSSVALENGVVVDEEKIIADWIENCHWRVDAAAIRQYVTRSKETYDWLQKKGYKTQFLNFMGEQMHMLPAYEQREGLLREMLAQSVEKNGGQVFTETTGKKLITNDEGAVTGVIAVKADGTTLEISAKNVIIATGGYAANWDMVKEKFGFEGVNGGLGQNVGEGLIMAWDVGAKVPDNIGGQMLHQTLARATSKLKAEYDDFHASFPLMLTYLPTLMNVGTSGARFRDEAAVLSAVASANTSAFSGPFHYVLLSKSHIEALTTKGMNGIKAPGLPGMPPEFYLSFMDKFTLDTPWDNALAVLDSMVANGDGFKGDSIEELAAKSGMDKEVLKENFNDYQNAVKMGKDNSFGKTPAFLLPYDEEGPYYAIIAEINNLGSVGGLLVNTKFQVLNDARIPVKGLYAVGLESEGVLFNDTYVGNGVGIGYSFTSGRLGGISAAGSALK